MKRQAKSFIVRILGWQVRRLQAKNSVTVVAVVGSIGKTSTKFAIARLLSSVKSVQWQQGNYNDTVTVPLVFFGHSLPSLFNPIAWLGVFIKNELQIIGNYPHDVVVLELGTDGPGQIAEFNAYLKVDIAVVTAITPEHMEFFKDLDAVAKEEFSVTEYSEELLVNTDLVKSDYYAGQKKVTTFGQKAADVTIGSFRTSDQKISFKLTRGSKQWLQLEFDGVSRAEAFSATAAAVVADKLKLSDQQIVEGIASLQPVSGRMQRLKGIKNSLIIDESYNSSPDAVIAVLDSLYMITAPQKIALLGNMNELGDSSRDEHIKVGEYCDPQQLDLVITLGPDANEYLAPAAEKAGCAVKKFTDPYAAGEFIKSKIKESAVVLVKGSQNNVYAEEAIKVLLADRQDAQKLVRQNAEWLKKKKANFNI